MRRLVHGRGRGSADEARDEGSRYGVQGIVSAMRRPLRWAAATTVSLVVIGAAAIAWVKLAPRPTPLGQAALATLDEKSFGQLRDVFNASADRVRVVALLSPT